MKATIEAEERDGIVTVSGDPLKDVHGAKAREVRGEVRRRS
ncbi:MAG TPA: hypothetical protein VJN42_08730 [Candidatus Acidoferrum sp.]|nr:hypothetical protein [Candidatus Acidoferrum sp.]